MKKVRFKCKRCGNRFVTEIFEPGEAKATRRSTTPVCCPECGGSVERI